MGAPETSHTNEFIPPKYEFVDRGPYDLSPLDMVIHAQSEAFEALSTANSGTEGENFDPEYVRQLQMRADALASDANIELARISKIEF